MEERKFQIGQTIYGANNYKMGRYVIDEYLIHETIDKTSVEVVLVDPTGRKVAYPIEDINTHFFPTFEECKSMALQNFEAHIKNMAEQIENFKDSDFDEIIKRMKEKQEKKEQGL